MATMDDDKAKLRADFEQLQREYKTMEAMRKAYSDESLAVIRKQRDAIEKLQRDVEALKSELEMESRYAQRKTVSDEVLSSLNEQVEMYTSKVEVERRNVDQLAKQIEVMKNKILDKRKDMGGVNACKENQKMVSKQIRILENRLDKALVKFNEALAINKGLRQEIDDLRKERGVFDSIYRKLERSLTDKKRQMAQIIEASNQSYESRDAAQMEIASLQQQMARDRQEFEEALLEINRREHARTPPPVADMTTEEEARLKSAVSKNASSVERERAVMMATRDKVASYEEGFNKIRAATGISGIEELVTTFIQNEDQNFSLFNFVAEQNNEIERLEEQIAQTRAELSKYSQESGDDIHQHKQLLRDLEARLSTTDAAAEKYEARFTEASRTVVALKGGIQSLFTRVGCDQKAMSELLADNTVTENNMMQFLGVIEQRTNEVMQKLARLTRERTLGESADSGDELLGLGRESPTRDADGEPKVGQTLVSLLGHGPSTRHGTEPMSVEPPKVDDYESDDDDSVDIVPVRPSLVSRR